jgi:hypothetical protein
MLVLSLRFDDEEDALHLADIVQHRVEGGLDRALPRIDAAPAVWPNALDGLVNSQRHGECRVLCARVLSRRGRCTRMDLAVHREVVVQRSQTRALLEFLGDIVGMPCVHLLCQFSDTLEVLFVFDRLGLACRDDLVEQRGHLVVVQGR